MALALEVFALYAVMRFVGAHYKLDTRWVIIFWASGVLLAIWVPFLLR